MKTNNRTRLATRSPRTVNKARGFTLIELLLVMAIIGILAVIAVPSYNDYMMKSRRSDGTATLMQIAALQEQFFMNNRRYTDDFTDLGLTVNSNDEVVSEGTHYLISINLPTDFNYLMTATPQGKQAEDTVCANFTLDNEGNRASTGSNTECW